MAYISCDSEPLAEDLFRDYDVDRMVRSIEAITNVPVKAEETLIVLDEIQEAPRGLSALKYFYEERPRYHIAIAGSLLGIALHSGTSFPVGKVDFLKMYPMDFEEFLLAKGETMIASAIARKDEPVLRSVHGKCVDLLRQYYYVGGMPEAVSMYCTDGSVIEVRKIQKAIVEAYRNDISKHAPLREIERIQLVLRTLPAQLARENKKFVYSAVRPGARASDFEVAIQWLVDAGIVNKVVRCASPKIPLAFYEDFNAFKLYLLDCGLFGAMVEADAADVLMGSDIFQEYKGAFSELYVLQQLLVDLSDKVYYFTADNSRIEIDYLVSVKSKVIPLEVKAEGNVKGKSLKLFVEKNDLPYGIRLSMLPYEEQTRLVNIPLYAAHALKTWLPS